jgi:hypothetical protein
LKAPSSISDVLSKAFVTVVALLYATGFLIVFTFLGRIGIRDLGDVLKAKYILVGALYWLIPVLIGLPTWAFVAMRERYNERKQAAGDSTDSPLPAPPMRATSLIDSIQFTLFLYVVVLLAPPGFVHANVGLIFTNCFLTIFGLRVINSRSEGLSRAKKQPPMTRWWQLQSGLADLDALLVAKCLHVLRSLYARLGGDALLVAGPLRLAPTRDFTSIRFSLSAFLLILDVVGLASLRGLIWAMIQRAVITILVFVLAGVILWRFSGLAARAKDPEDKANLWWVATAIVAGCYLLSVVGFAYSIYPFVPAERGGGNYSHTGLVVVALTSRNGVPDDLLDRKSGERNAGGASVTAEYLRTKPLKLIEQTSSWIYVARPEGCEMPAEWRPTIIALRTDMIASITLYEEK